MRSKHVLCIALFTAVSVLAALTGHASDREVSFRTDDGWTIHGTLSLPENVKGRVPVVILLPSPAHDRTAFGIYRYPGQYQYPGMAPVITGRGVAALSLDLRGRGKSMKGKATDAGDGSNVHLDVCAAMSFLKEQPGLDASRVGIVAEEASADAAVMGWRGDTTVRAMALISGRLSEAAKQQIAASPQLPMFLVVSSEDKPGFADMTDAYFLSKTNETNIDVYYGLGAGTSMFSVWRYKYPKEKPLHETIGDWMADQLLSTGTLAEVSFQTEDGWTIFGNFRVPQLRAGKLPAVILLHSGLSDRNAYHDLEIALAKEGLAVLNIDWRGKGKSTGKGKYFEISRAERDKGYLDAKAAVNFLAAEPHIDVNRIGILGTVIGAKYAMAALADDPRIKTAVVLTGYIPTEKEKAYLGSQKVPVLLITSKGHRAVTEALTQLYGLGRNTGSELVVYDGGAIGYQLFELDESLQPRVVRWMKEKLSQ